MGWIIRAGQNPCFSHDHAFANSIQYQGNGAVAIAHN
jgi:hypothetical protein